MDKQEFQPNESMQSVGNQYIQRLEEAHGEIMELAREAMQLGNYKRAEQIVRDGFYAIAFDDYQRSIHIYKGIKQWAEENRCEEIVKEPLSKILKLNIEKQKSLCNFDQKISPLILEMINKWGEK